MKLDMKLNGRHVSADVAADAILLDVLRDLGCYSVKRGCETANCGLCTVLMNGKPILSCSTPAMRACGHEIVTIESLQTEAAEFAGFMADQGADQCGFCNPGFMMNVIAMLKELEDPDEEQIKAYLAGNLCRCTGFMSQHRAIAEYLNFKKNGGERK